MVNFLEEFNRNMPQKMSGGDIRRELFIKDFVGHINIFRAAFSDKEQYFEDLFDDFYEKQEEVENSGGVMDCARLIDYTVPHALFKCDLMHVCDILQEAIKQDG